MNFRSKAAFAAPQRFSLCLDLLISWRTKGEEALAINNGYLTALLKQHFDCNLDVVVTDNVKPLYADSVKEVASLENEDKMKEIFQVSDSKEIEFSALPILSEEDHETHIWIAEQAEKMCNASTENTTLSSPIPFFILSSSEDAANQTPTISPNKRARFLQILEQEGISLNALLSGESGGHSSSSLAPCGRGLG